MPSWLTYTLLGTCALALGFGLWVAGDRGRARFARLSKLAPFLQLAAIVFAYLVVRPGVGDDGAKDIAAASAADRPIFVDLYSNF